MQQVEGNRSCLSFLSFLCNRVNLINFSACLVFMLFEVPTFNEVFAKAVHLVAMVTWVFEG